MKKIVNYPKLVKSIKPYVEQIQKAYPDKFMYLYHNSDDLKNKYYKYFVDDILISALSTHKSYLVATCYGGYRTCSYKIYSNDMIEYTTEEDKRKVYITKYGKESYHKLKLLFVVTGVNMHMNYHNSFFQSAHELSHVINILLQSKMKTQFEEYNVYNLICLSKEFSETDCQLFAYACCVNEFGKDKAFEIYKNANNVGNYKFNEKACEDINNYLDKVKTFDVFEVAKQIYKILLKYCNDKADKHLLNHKFNIDIPIPKDLKSEYWIKREELKQMNILDVYKYLMHFDKNDIM